MLSKFFCKHGLNDDWKHIITGGKVLKLALERLHLTHTFFDNHASSQFDLKFICAYIAGEQAAGHYSEVYTPDMLESITGPF